MKTYTLQYPNGVINYDYAVRYPQWEMCRDFYNGSDAVKQKGERYLAGLDDPDLYPKYLQGALFVDIFAKTVVSLEGMVFRKSPEYKFPEQLGYLERGCDILGNSLYEFARDVVKNTLITGHGCVVVDVPEDGDGKPIFAYYDAFNTLSWQYSVENGTKLSEVIVSYDAGASPSNYGARLVGKKRYYKENGVVCIDIAKPTEALGDVTVYEFIPEKTIIPQDANGNPLTEIPAIVFNADNIDLRRTDVPPLKAVADMAQSIYKSYAELEWARHFVAMPHIWVSGVDPENKDSKPVAIGASSTTFFSNADAKMNVLTLGSLQPLEKAIEMKLEEAINIGAVMASPGDKIEETAEGARLKEASKHGNLAAIATNLSQVITKGLEMACAWLSIDSSDIIFNLNTDFFPATYDASLVTAVITAWKEGLMLTEDARTVLSRFNLVDPTISFEESIQRIQSELVRKKLEEQAMQKETLPQPQENNEAE